MFGDLGTSYEFIFILFFFQFNLILFFQKKIRFLDLWNVAFWVEHVINK